MRLVSCLAILALAGCGTESPSNASQVVASAAEQVTASAVESAAGQSEAMPEDSAGGAIEVGSIAPHFELPGSDGQSHKLSDYAGQHVVLAFFPKAFTGG